MTANTIRISKVLKMLPFGLALLSSTALCGSVKAEPFQTIADDPVGFENTDISVSPDGSSVTIWGSSSTVSGAVFVNNGSGFIDIGNLGKPNTSFTATSADGSVVVGRSMRPDDVVHAYRWTSAAGIQDLGTLGGSTSYALGVSHDGATVVGYSAALGTWRAFRWTEASGMQDIGALSSGGLSQALNISADGTTIVGRSVNAGGENHAMRWTAADGMQDLGTLGGTSSLATLVSNDGAVAAGYSHLAGGNYHAFRWTDASGMTDLGTLGGPHSEVNALSADGSVLSGRSYSADNHARVFRWTEAGGITDIGTLGGNETFFGDMDASGSIIVGSSYEAAAVSASASIWTADAGIQSLSEYLTAKDVDTAGWRLDYATSISDDGNVIAGDGQDSMGTTGLWWTRVGDTKTGLISDNIINRSFASLSSLDFVANNMAASTLDPAGVFSMGAGDGQGTNTAWASGFYDSDPVIAAEIGASHRLSNGIRIGASFGLQHFYDSLDLDGSFSFTGPSATVFAGATPANGLQWLVSASASQFSGKVTRGYLNGATADFSSGNTSGHTIGFMAKAGWTFDNVLSPNTKLTPYASLTTTSSHFKGWTETGGAFPGSVSAINGRATTARLGTELRHQFTPQLEGWINAAWAHRLDRGRLSDISGSVAGITAVSLGNFKTAQDWAEIGGGATFDLGGDFKIATSLTAIAPTLNQITLQARTTLKVSF